MTNCYSALFFTLNMQIFSTALYSGIRRKDQEKREKIFRNICKVKNNPYLCTAFEKQGSSHEELWRGGRVVDCGGLENRCTARYPGFESELTAYCDALHWMRPGRQYLCNVYNTVCHAFHLLRRNPVRDNRLLVTEKELRHAERMLPELGRQTFTEMVRLKGYMVYDAEQLADKCGMEYGSFRRKVKKMTGYTAKEWVIKERAKDVEHYLKNTNLTLTEVAFTTGFASTSNLNDFCKAYLLDTPGEIRRKAQETRKCTVTRT